MTSVPMTTGRFLSWPLSLRLPNPSGKHVFWHPFWHGCKRGPESRYNTHKIHSAHKLSEPTFLVHERETLLPPLLFYITIPRAKEKRERKQSQPTVVRQKFHSAIFYFFLDVRCLIPAGLQSNALRGEYKVDHFQISPGTTKNRERERYRKEILDLRANGQMKLSPDLISKIKVFLVKL